MNQPYRSLSIYTDLIAGKTVNKAKLANEWEVSKRTIQRDIAHIRNFMYERCEWFVIENPIVYDTDNDSYYLNQSIQKTEPHFTFLRLNKIEKQKIFVKFEVNMNMWDFFRKKYALNKYSSNGETVIASLHITEEEALVMSFKYRGQIRLLEPETVKQKLIYDIAHLQSFYKSGKAEQ
ncbi:HTH domain-containing protein [Staphylococcus pseudintermedius]|nr:HTH domain-containing protein [Staphylococcus pseudintermedius]